MKRLLLCLAATLLLPGRLAAEPSLIEHVAVFLTGTFSNAEQARADQNFRATTLHGSVIWKDRTDGPWLYLEQALAGAEDHPYRQVVYQLAAGPEDRVEIRVFDPINVLAFTGAGKDSARADRFTPADLTPRGGCTLVLRLQPGGSFKGGTEGKECGSALRGAAYATTEMDIANREISFWERGFNAAGAQVWGSIHGGHVFKRVE